MFKGVREVDTAELSSFDLLNIPSHRIQQKVQAYKKSAQKRQLHSVNRLKEQKRNMEDMLLRVSQGA